MNIFDRLICAKNNIKLENGVISGYIDIPHSIWSHYGFAGKRKYKTKKGLLYEKYIKSVFKYKVSGKVIINVNFYFNSERLNDIDNPLKALLDSLKYAGVFEDDSLVIQLNVNKYTPAIITEKYKVKKPVGFKGSCYIEIIPAKHENHLTLDKLEFNLEEYIA